MPSRKDICICGELKDSRSHRCRTCFIGEDRAERLCTKCRVLKPVSDFRIRTRSTPKPRSHCRECEAKQAIKYRTDNPDKHAQAKRGWEKRNPDKHGLQLLRRRARILGLDPEMILEYFASHDGKCEICGDPPSGRFKTLSIDHDHSTGAFRGLLCGSCNLAIGVFRDDTNLLQRAIDYLSS